MATIEALKLAMEKGLDLIEVSPLSKPPVARIMSFDKYRYQQEKKLKKQKASVGKEWKQIQVTVRSGKNDLGLKAQKMAEFLKEGHPVGIVMVLRGREKGNKNWAMEKFKEFILMFEAVFGENYKTLGNPKFGGKGIIASIGPK
jgi:translation initiation factor IF-3